MLYRIAPLLIAIFFTSCGSISDITKSAEDILGISSTPSNAETIGGLKDALSQGVTKGANAVSKTDGYLKNLAIKILFPPEAVKAEKTLRDMGLNKLCDNVIQSFNRAAETAALEAKPIFIAAIKGMTFKDAMNILLGADNSATEYFKGATSSQLYAKFKPVIDKSLGKVGATKYWGDVTSRYNKIPLVKKLPTDVSDYVANKAIDGLFVMVEKEERKIRHDPLSRATSLMKKVFGYADNKKNG